MGSPVDAMLNSLPLPIMLPPTALTKKVTLPAFVASSSTTKLSSMPESARTTCSTPVNGWLQTCISLAIRHALTELLGKPDNDALGAADVTEPIRVVVLHHFADQVGAVGAQAP